MGEGRHDRSPAWTEATLFARHQVEFADFGAQTVVGHGFECVKRVEIVG